MGDDDDYLVGRRKQDPIYAVEARLVRRFRPGFWASIDANYFTGGRQTVGGDKLEDLQSNRRFGVTLVVPFRSRSGRGTLPVLDNVRDGKGNYGYNAASIAGLPTS